MQTTNDLLDRVCKEVQQLVDWAGADAEHSLESGSGAGSYQAQQDRKRQKKLQRALALLNECGR
jgi:hypothetical protein